MGDLLKPVPQVDNDSREFWNGCNEDKLLIQHCKECNTYIFYPRIVCPHCMSANIEWEKSAGIGKVYSYTIVRYGPPGFKDDVPYIAALVELDEGVRMITNIIDCDIDKVKCDMPVEVIFEKRETVKVPMFRPIVR